MHQLRNVVLSLLLLVKISVPKYVKAPSLYELRPKSDQFFFQQKQTKITPKCTYNCERKKRISIGNVRKFVCSL